MPRVGSLRYVTIYSYTSDALPLRRTSPDGDWTENVYDENRRRVGQASSDPSCEYGFALANCGVATNETASVGLESASVARSVDAYGRVVSLSRDGVEDAVVYNPTNGLIAAISNAEAWNRWGQSPSFHDRPLAAGRGDGDHAGVTVSRTWDKIAHVPRAWRGFCAVARRVLD